MKNNLTEIIFILDRSGSMSGLEKDTIGGYNSFLKKQKKLKGDTQVTTILFDDQYEIIHNGKTIKDAQLDEDTYFTRGSTALLDAIGKSITDVTHRHKTTKEKHLPSKTIFVITTDGYENSSFEYTYSDIKRMIDKKQRKNKWDFIFIGANIDEKAEAKKLNIKESIAFESSASGVYDMYEKVNACVSKYRE